MEVREKEVQSLQSQALALSQEDAGLNEVDGQQRRVTDSFGQLQDPLKQRQQRLLASKEAHQFNRDLEDEIVSGGFVFDWSGGDSWGAVKRSSESLRGVVTHKFHICSVNNFPTAAGLASSAAGYACLGRSEERRVGKECLRLCRSRWSPYH